jgi:hypothetical protein
MRPRRVICLNNVIYLIYIIILLILLKKAIDSAIRSRYSKVVFKTKNKYDPFDQIDGYKIFLQDEWVFNMNVSMYSSTVIQELDGTLIVESNVLLDNPDGHSYMEKHLKCLIKLNQSIFMIKPFEIINVDFMPINPLADPNQVGFFKSFHRVRCIIEEPEDLDIEVSLMYKQIRVAVVEDLYFDYYMAYFKSHKHLITFQKPLFFTKSEPKIKGVANCVHMVTNLGKLDIL